MSFGRLQMLQVSGVTIEMSAKESSLYRISAGDIVAEIHPVGASLVGLHRGGTSLMAPWDPTTALGRYQGSIIAPWPNRVGDGHYTFKGGEYFLPVNETSRNNALHGFTAEKSWHVGGRSENRISFSLHLEASKGYPWSVELDATYRAEPDRLTVSLLARNSSDNPAPFGAGFHPYFALPGAKRPEWLLVVEADEVIIPDSDRLLPLSHQSVAGSTFDFRHGRLLGNRVLDHAFGPNISGAHATIRAANSATSIHVSGDAYSPWMQIHNPQGHGPFANSLVVEPTTCPPNAFQTGVGLTELEPSGVMETFWEILIVDPIAEDSGQSIP